MIYKKVAISIRDVPPDKYTQLIEHLIEMELYEKSKISVSEVRE